MQDQICDITKLLVERGVSAVGRHLNESDLPVDYVAIFAKNDEEYSQFTREIEKAGKIVEETPTGFTYKLKAPIPTCAGPLDSVKIRKPDAKKQQRGAPDFRVGNYAEFKKRHIGNPKVNLIERGEYEMLELVGDDILVYFPNKPLSAELASS